MQSFTYTASIKLVTKGGGAAVLEAEYPGATDMSVKSREFHDYNECVTSCRTFMDDMKTRIAEVDPKTTYKVSSEVNPEHNNGIKTLSKDWEISEVSRLWIFDEKMAATGQIVALGQARIFGSDRSQRILAS